MAPKLIATGIPELIPMVRTGDPRRHVSHIIRKLCLALGHFEDTGDPNTSLMELGSAFEDAVATSLAKRWATAYPDRFIQPGELELGGLIGTPDLFDIIDNAIVEIKLTKISSRHDIESDKFWKYWVQVKTYCTMIGVNTGRVHIGHINGDYKGIEVHYNVWEDTFTPSELYENWRMISSHAG